MAAALSGPAEPETGLTDAGLAQAGLADPGLADPGLAEPGLAEVGLGDPGLRDAVSIGDGRRLRRDRNRTAVVDALLDLYGESNLRPSTAEIAERAGLSHRSLFRYFDDFDDLCREAIRRAEQRARPLIPIEVDRAAPLPERIEALVTQRLRLFGTLGKVAQVSRLNAPFAPVLAAELTKNRAFLRAQLADLFAPELNTPPPAGHPEKADAAEGADVAEGADISGRAGVARGADVSGGANVAGGAGVARGADVSGGADVAGRAELAGGADVGAEADLAGGIAVIGGASVAERADAADGADVTGESDVAGRDVWTHEVDSAGAGASAALAAADVLCSFESYHLLSTDQRLTGAEIRAVLTSALTALLDPLAN
jgi:TetR/AcrR family transcriptional regulator, regulator of autoinduction and epiphytic fitness